MNLLRRLEHSRCEEIKIAVAELIEDYGLSYPLNVDALLSYFNVAVIEHSNGFTGLKGAELTDDGFTETV